MKVQVEEGTLWKRTLKIEIPPERVSKEMEEVVKEFRNRLEIPGFRKGRAPLGLVEAQLGSGLDVEFLKRVVPRAYEEALREAQLEPICDPSFDDISFKRGQALTFTATFEVKPQVEVSGYKGLGLEKIEFEISDDDMERALEEVRKSNPEFVAIAREAREGDLVVIDYERLGKTEGAQESSKVQSYAVVLGSHTLLDEIEKALEGAVAGDEKKVRANLPASHSDKKLAGSSISFRIKVKEIKERKEAVLDDEFSKRLGATGGLEELRARVKLELDGKAIMRSQELLESSLFDELSSMNTFDLPESMVERMLGHILEKQDPDVSPKDDAKLREELKPSIMRFIKRLIVIQQVAKQESIQVTDKDVDDEIARIAAYQQLKPEEVKERLQGETELGRLRDNLLERRVIDSLVSQANVKIVKQPLPKPEGN
ncbi:MAG: trigger factor [Candidatus Eisenbacteria bacterium]|nr:trigger factor [Candidatus Eisenbacteria bacterium]